MKYLSTLLCLLPFWAWAQQDTARPVFKLEIEVRDLDTDFPLENANVKITSTDGDRAEFVTDAKGKVKIDAFLKAEKNYLIEVSRKGYCLYLQQPVATGNLSTVNHKNSEQFLRTFKLQKNPLTPFFPDLYGYRQLDIPVGATTLPDDVKAELDRCTAEAKKPRIMVVLLIPYGEKLSSEVKAKMELAQQYLLSKVPKNKIAVVEKPGMNKEGVFVKSLEVSP